MRKFIVFLGLSAGLFAQNSIPIPFDWAGQNGIIISDGALFWNRAWTSGMLMFDGTYTSYPKRFESNTTRGFQPGKTGILPTWSGLPDSNNVESFFDYYRGDYSYNQLEVGAKFEELNRRLDIRGFKRTYFGNTGHYIHPDGASSPIHHSYRANYAAKKGAQKLEVSAGRFITHSGLPDTTGNGFENDNIISGGVRYQRPLGDWIMDTYVGQFFQHRLVHHSTMVDSNYRDINRNRVDLLFQSPSGLGFGINHNTQQINADTLKRALTWTTVFAQKKLAGFNFMAGLPILNSDDKGYAVWDVSYHKQFNRAYVHFSTSGIPNPKHPDTDNPDDNSNFESWNRSVIKSGIMNGPLSGDAFISLVRKKKDEIQKDDSQIVFVGANIQFEFGNGWSTYTNALVQLDSSIYGSGFGAISAIGVKGKLNLFKNNMKIKAHLWADGSNGKLASFGFDPIRQVPFYNTNSDWALPDQWLLHFEAVANISGVLVSFKVNNISNLLGSISDASSDDLVWARPNHVYPRLGRMMQFGVTWTFNN